MNALTRRVVLTLAVLGALVASSGSAAFAAKPTPNGQATDKQVIQQCKRFGGTAYITPTRSAYECDFPTRAKVADGVAIQALCTEWGGAAFFLADGDSDGFIDAWTCEDATH